MRELRHPTTGDLCRQVGALQTNPQANLLVSARGLNIVKVSWDDCARNKGSAWGPCISDMTLVVEDETGHPHRMPIIRHPNFTDMTWDVPMDRIPLVVKNERQTLFGEPLATVALDTYLDKISEYTDLTCGSLYAPRDSHAVVSAQACFLPIQEGTKINFHVELYNYQSRTEDPAVLVLVATSKGTSAQVLNQQNSNGFFYVGGQKLWFNRAGHKCTFTAMRLKDDRAERGVPLTGPMTSSEKQNNVIVVVQVPLRQRQRTSTLFACAKPQAQPLFGSGGFGGGGFGAANPQPQALFGAMGSNPSGGTFGSAPPTPLPDSDFEPPSHHSVDVEPAIVGLGPTQGAFPSLKDIRIARDERFPVRVTIQWYKSTTNGVLNREVVDSIANQMEEAKSKGDWWGSLVVGDFLNTRPTAPVLSPPPLLSSGFGNPVKHDAYCDKCRQMIVGVRYRCSVCPDFDLCEYCEAAESHGHPPNHLFLKVKRGGQDAYGRNPVLYNGTTQVHSCFCNVCKNRIVGTRFRCTVCDDFDLCMACEASCGHADFQHPLLKMFQSQGVPSTPVSLFGAQ